MKIICLRVSFKKKYEKKNCFASLKSLKKGVKSGVDPDPELDPDLELDSDPDPLIRGVGPDLDPVPHQNVTDFQLVFGDSLILLRFSTFTELQNLSEGFTDIPFALEITLLNNCSHMLF
jgi:hypothetical protein